MKEKKVCFISSTGGHFEQLMQLSYVSEKYNCYYILPDSKSFEKLNKKKFLITNISKKNKIYFVYSFIFSSFQQLYIFFRQRPDIVITTGAGFVVPTCLISKIFGKKLIYIESFARIRTLNKTGKFLYKYADLFVVQWKDLQKLCPKAVYRGWIY